MMFIFLMGFVLVMAFIVREWGEIQRIMTIFSLLFSGILSLSYVVVNYNNGYNNLW